MPRKARELSPLVGDKVEAAYRRGGLFEERVALVSEWGAFSRSRDSRGVAQSQHWAVRTSQAPAEGGGPVTPGVTVAPRDA
jgi:hypothetical protein